MLIHRKQIERTVACYWSEPDDVFIARSFLFKPLIAAGETREQALTIYMQLLDEQWPDYGRQMLEESRKRPLPSPNLIADIQPSTLSFIKEVADRLGTDENHAIEYLVEYARDAMLPLSSGQDVTRPPAIRPS